MLTIYRWLLMLRRISLQTKFTLSHTKFCCPSNKNFRIFRGWLNQKYLLMYAKFLHSQIFKKLKRDANREEKKNEKKLNKRILIQSALCILNVIQHDILKHWQNQNERRTKYASLCIFTVKINTFINIRSDWHQKINGVRLKIK